ncbi:TorF family putative porin [Novosphingobium sp.]|uniref:TorF family putative porin n=1 Tax=Novosphingobium sp. TaxID=1874826 RepID=UPI0025EC4F10|nr:TorF family putative porin [Novosphingobium sp.]
MRRYLTCLQAGITASCLIIGGAAAHAQDVPAAGAADTAPTIAFDASIALVSDYRFRGVSLSDKGPALQPNVTLTHKSGLYLDLWGSNVADNGGADVELDVTLGFANTLGPVDYHLAAAWYTYPGAGQFNYVELRAGLGVQAGPAKVGVEAAYAPRQDHIGGEDNLYLGINAELPLSNSPFTLTATFGHENGAFADNKLDWSIGAKADLAGFELSAAYVDTAHTFGDLLTNATAVVSLSRSF